MGSLTCRRCCCRWRRRRGMHLPRAQRQMLVSHTTSEKRLKHRLQPSFVDMRPLSVRNAVCLLRWRSAQDHPTAGGVEGSPCQQAFRLEISHCRSAGWSCQFSVAVKLSNLPRKTPGANYDASFCVVTQPRRRCLSRRGKRCAPALEASMLQRECPEAGGKILKQSPALSKWSSSPYSPRC